VDVLSVNSHKAVLMLRNSTVKVEPSPVGPVGRVEPEDGVAEYAVIAEETLGALAEVAEAGGEA
jgi:hypothetical protein